MLEAFVITLREGVEAALIVGITLAYLAKIGRPELRKSVYSALGAAFVCSIAVAILLSRTKWTQDIFEGWIILQKFFKVTAVILFFVAGQLIITGLHELSENGVLPSSKEEMSIIGPIVRNDIFFFVTIFALAAFMVLLEVKRREPVAVPSSP